MSEIRAFGRQTLGDGTAWYHRTDNAQLIADCRQLGYITGNVIDLTYGYGKFWSIYRPDNLHGIDINPDRCDPKQQIHEADFRDTGLQPDMFDTVVFDPPYKLNGTSTGKGPSAADERYGVDDAYMSIANRHRMICDGITEAHRICRPEGHILIKCQDQVSSGRVQWQTYIFTDHARALGAHLVDMLHVVGCRTQPKGRRQLHARRDYSTLLVCKKGRK